MFKCINQNNLTMKKLPLFICCLLLLAACGSHHQRKNSDTADQAERKSVEIERSIFFISTISPNGEGDWENINKTLNKTAKHVAAQEGKKEATVFKSEAGHHSYVKKGRYLIYPIFTPEKLDSLAQKAYNYMDKKDSVKAFDFDKELALVISQEPDPYSKENNIESLNLESESRDLLQVSFSSDAYPGQGNDYNSNAKWQTSVYKVPWKGQHHLTFIFKNDTTLIPLKTPPRS